jgi:hypothetical protein
MLDRPTEGTVKLARVLLRDSGEFGEPRTRQDAVRSDRVREAMRRLAQERVLVAG